MPGFMTWPSATDMGKKIDPIPEKARMNTGNGQCRYRGAWNSMESGIPEHGIQFGDTVESAFAVTLLLPRWNY